GRAGARAIVHAERAQEVRAQRQVPAPADTDVPVRHERAARAGIGEVVPRVDGDRLRRLVALAVDAFHQDQRQIAEADLRGHLLADAADARDERRAVAPFVIFAGRTEA